MKLTGAARKALPEALPLWPPLLAVRGVGSASTPHAHHAMHLVIAVDGHLRVRKGRAGKWVSAPGVLTAPDVLHSVDGSAGEVLLLFLDPESAAGQALRPATTEPVRLLNEEEAHRFRSTLPLEPGRILRADGIGWVRDAVAILGGEALPARRPIHPRVRSLLNKLRDLPPDADLSIDALAAASGLSTGRLMHAFTESVGVPLRPYLAWLRIQRAVAAIVADVPLSQAALAAGFSDAAHLSRMFRRMLGMSPSMLKPARAS
jgi:AraC-like DNA-binding protein